MVHFQEKQLSFSILPPFTFRVWVNSKRKEFSPWEQILSFRSRPNLKGEVNMTFMAHISLEKKKSENTTKSRSEIKV